MPERDYNAGGYRYGFNGKEMDNEPSGQGNQYDYGMRIYNPRLGKFLSVDPYVTSYPMLSSYQFAGNTPIQAIDLDGGEPKSVITFSSWGPFVSRIGKISESVIGFIAGATDMSRASLRDIRFEVGTGHVIWTVAEYIESRKGNILSAITFEQTVYYSEDMKNSKDVYQWIGLAAHESSHGRDYAEQSTLGFLLNYISENSDNKAGGMQEYDAYRGIGTEVKGWGFEEDIANFFSNSNNVKSFDEIFNDSKLTEAQKANKLEALAIRGIAVPRIDAQIQKLQATAYQDISTSEKTQIYNQITILVQQKVDLQKRAENLENADN